MTFGLAILLMLLMGVLGLWCLFKSISGDGMMCIVGAIALALAGATIPDIGPLRDKERLPLVRSAYPGLIVTSVFHSGKNVIFYADAARQLECEGALTVDEVEVGIEYEFGPRTACEAALDKALARAVEAERRP